MKVKSNRSGYILVLPLEQMERGVFLANFHELLSK